jgi:hypothetical protein
VLGQLRLFMVGGPCGESTEGPELSLKLYHARKLPLDYQQLITEAPQSTLTVIQLCFDCEAHLSTAM